MRTTLLWTAAVISALLSLGMPLVWPYVFVALGDELATNYGEASWFAGTLLSVTALTVVWLRPKVGDWIPASVLAASAVPNLGLIAVKWGYRLNLSGDTAALIGLASVLAIPAIVFCPFYAKRIARFWRWRCWGYTFLSVAILVACVAAYYWPLNG